MRRVSVSERMKKIFALGIIMGAAAGILFTVLIANGIISRKEEIYAAKVAELTEENDTLQQQAAKNQAVNNNTEIMAGNEEGWSLALVNESHPMADTSYAPAEMTEIESERSVDSRIAENLEQMLSDGAAQGLSMYVASAYRSYEQQRDVFDATMRDWINQGYSPLSAYDETKKSVAVPGTSEHATGLAVDIISSEYEALDDRQGDTDEQKWLMEHCWEYGFILRYPPEKSDVTGIIYEPWHYRYVGKDVAKEITEQGITLEEYLGE